MISKPSLFKHISWLLPLLLTIAIIVTPLVVDSVYVIGTLVVIGIYSIVTISLCLLMGYAGQISLGHAAFFGLGAYGSAILTVRYGINPWLALVCAAGITGFIAWAIGIPTLKLKEHYLALATLGFGIIINIILNQETALTGGPSGLPGIPYIAVGDFVFNNDFSYYYLVWAVVLLTVFICGNIVNSRIGRALRAIHGSEIAAEAMGVNTAQHKLQIFVISAVFASIAGSLYAHYVTVVTPSPFGYKTSIEFVLMAVVGGIASIWGPMIGAGAVTILTESLRDVIPQLIPGSGGEVEIVAFGLILAVVMIFMPEGLFRGIVNRFERTLVHPYQAEDESDGDDSLWEEVNL